MRFDGSVQPDFAPRPNLQHRHAQWLIDAFVFNRATGSAPDLAGSLSGTLNGNAAWTAARSRGVGISTGSDGYVRLKAGSIACGLAAYTTIFGFRLRSLPGAQKGIYSEDDSNGTRFRSAIDSTNHLFVGQSQAGSYTDVASPIAAVAGQDYSLCAAFSQAQSFLGCHVNGSLVASSGSPVINGPYTITSADLGHYTNAGAFSSDIVLYYAYFYSARLGGATIADIAARPYAMFLPVQQPKVWTFAAGPVAAAWPAALLPAM